MSRLDNAAKLLNDSGYSAKLICSKMEAEQGTFDKIASYLKKDGIFIFSWHHTLNYCVAWSCDERKDA